MVANAGMRRFKLVQFGQPLCEAVEPLPVLKGHEVLLRVTACGVCHSDLHIIEGHFDLGQGKRLELSNLGLPRVLGHETVGEVEAIGPDAQGVAVGDRRVVYPWIGCGQCRVCLSGQEHLCAKPRALGAQADGGFGTHIVVPHPRYLVDFDGLPERFACTCACSGLTAYSALKKAASIIADGPLLIVGAGGVGLAAVHLAQLVFGVRPGVADIDRGKREAAARAGASQVIDPGADDLSKPLVKATQGGFAAVIDFVGSQSTAELGIAVLRRGGRLISVGLLGGAVNLSLPLLAIRSITLSGSYVGSLDEFRELIDILKRHGPYPLPVTERPLEQVDQTLDDLSSGRVLGRAVLVPRSALDAV